MEKKKHLRLYRTTVYLIAASLFVVFTMLYLTALFSNTNLPDWLSGTKDFIVSLYPNILIMPLTFLCTLFFLRPIQRAEKDVHEEKLLQQIEQRVSQKMYEHVMNASKTSETLAQMGIRDIAERLDYKLVGKRIATAQTCVLILKNWLCYNLYEYEEAFFQAAQKNVFIRIALLDPDSEIAKQRSRDLGQPDHYVSDQIKDNVKKMREIQKKFNLKNIEVRLYTSLPSLQLFICDEQALVGFFLQRVESQYTPHLDLLLKGVDQEDTKFGKRVKEEFECVWKKALPVSGV